MAEAKPRKRVRKRRVNSGSQPAARVEVPQEIKELADKAFKSNKLMNQHKREYDAARKELSTKLNDLRAEDANTDFSYSTIIDGKQIELEVGVQEGSVLVIDMAKLKSLISEKDYETIVTTSKTAITNTCGATIADQCTTSKGNGVFTARVSAAK